jgi:hypothetical protein
MLIKTETYTADDGTEMKREYFGEDADHIECIVNTPVAGVEIMAPLISEKEEMELENYNNLSYLTCLAELSL